MGNGLAEQTVDKLYNGAFFCKLSEMSQISRSYDVFAFREAIEE